MRKIVAVVGDAEITENEKKYEVAYAVGKLLVENGYRVQSGGLDGVMHAAFCGAKAAKNATDGDTIAIVPSFNRRTASPCADIVIATGLDLFRNVIVANADAVVAIGGGSGTLSEMANAWAMKRLIVAVDCVDGWSKNMANKRPDKRIRYPELPDDKIFGASTAEEVVRIINEKIDLYTSVYTGIVK